jgi:hypothetical protein
VRERDHNALAGANERTELVLRLGEPARDERRSLRLERERLIRREGIEHGRALERHRLESLLLPDRAHLVGLPDEIRPFPYRQDKVVRDGPEGLSLRQVRFDQVEAPLGGRVDNRGLDRMQRALCERRKSAHLLDLVPPELNTQRLAAGRREHVDKTPADRELAALLGPLHTLVPREAERLGKLLEADLLTGSDANRLRPRIRRRHRLRQRSGRGADETPRCEHIQRAGPLADEVRRGLETGAPMHTAAWQQRNAFVAEEPRGTLRGVARVRILRRQQHEWAVELFVQRREQQRERGLGHACGRGERLGEALEALALTESVDEGVQDRLVHDERPNRPGSAGSS